jgi:hypothetical protein
MNKLELLTPCVLCTGARNKQGYGRRKYKGKDERAHRVAYAEHHGLTMADIKGVTIQSIIAKDFGVDRSTIGYIKAGKSWGHL